MSKNTLPSLPAASNIINTNTDCQTVERAEAHLIRLENKMPDRLVWSKVMEDWVRNPPFNSSFDLPGARKTLAKAQLARKLLPAVIRPAVADEIATQLSLLKACDIHQSKDERQRQIFMQMLCQDVADLKPSVYALQIACRRLRQNYTFSLAFAEVLTELKKAQQQAKRLTKLDARLTKLQKQLDDFEHDLPHLKKREAARKAQAADRIAESQGFPTQNFGLRYSADELDLLGLTAVAKKRRATGSYDF